MKYFCFILSILIHFIGLANDPGISFRNIPYDQLFKTAKEEEKLVFLYFHFDGCGACVKMEKSTFINLEVAEYANANFVSFEINTQKGEGKEINKIYHVRSHPTFMLLDQKGNILHKCLGFFSPEEFLEQIRNAANGKSRYIDFIEKYKRGNRQPDFLYEYCYVLRNVNELTCSIITEYIQTQALDSLITEKNIKFIYEFALHHHDDCISFNSEAYHFMHTHRELFTAYFEGDQVDTRLVWIANHAAQKAMLELNDEEFYKTLEIIKQFPTGKWYEYKEMDGRLTGVIMDKNIPLSLERAYALKKGNMEDYLRFSKEYLDRNWNDPEVLNDLAWDIYEKEDDPKKIKEAITWVRRSLHLEKWYANLDTYAALLYKAGDYKKAYKQAQKAIIQAKEEEEDYSETSKLLEKIEAKLGH